MTLIVQKQSNKNKTPVTRRIYRYICLITFVTQLLSCKTLYKKKVTKLSKAKLTGQQVWHGQVIVSGDLTLDNCYLRILPGTIVLLGKGCKIGGTGSIVSRGTRNKPIIFTSIPQKKPSLTKKVEKNNKWGEIFISHSQESIFEHCIFENATWGLHLHFSNTLVKNCSFTNSYGGIRFRSGPVVILSNSFSNNKIALRLNNSSPYIVKNTFKDNFNDIFFRNGIKRGKVINNNFLRCKGYRIQLGESQNHDILLVKNWWGTKDPSIIEQFFYDKRHSEYLGRVIYRPFLTDAFPSEKPTTTGRQQELY